MKYGVFKKKGGWFWRHYGTSMTADAGPYKTRSEAMVELLVQLGFPVEDEVT